LSNAPTRRFARDRRAVVIGRWADYTALVRVEGGRTLELPVPEGLRAEVDVGTVVLLDPAEGRLLGVEPVRTA
jgi:hypothetical protein